MKLLRQTIRKLILQEGMNRPEQLPEGIVVVIKQEYGGIDVYYAKLQPDGTARKVPAAYESADIIWGSVSLYPTEDMGYGPCSGAAKVGVAEAADGWGPLLYDVAMEQATAAWGGLIPDRRSVSSDARRVWDHYMIKRRDVDHFQLDDLYDRLTPDPDDNCDQEVAQDDMGAYDWLESPLSKMYVKNNTEMTDKLNALGKLFEIG